MSLSEKSHNKVVERYTQKYQKFGYSQKTLGWDKGKQDIRFDILTSKWDLENKSILDIGCGFGDLYPFLQNKFQNIKYYHGIDLVPALITQGKKLYNKSNCKLEVVNFLEWEPTRSYDFIIISGIFNFKLESEEINYQFIKDILEKSFFLANIGVSSNFLSNKVDFELAHAFHSSPTYILDHIYTLTRNVVLMNDYFPFEFTVHLDKRDSFDKNDTIFKSLDTKYE